MLTFHGPGSGSNQDGHLNSSDFLGKFANDTNDCTPVVMKNTLDFVLFQCQPHITKCCENLECIVNVFEGMGDYGTCKRM